MDAKFNQEKIIRANSCDSRADLFFSLIPRWNGRRGDSLTRWQKISTVSVAAAVPAAMDQFAGDTSAIRTASSRGEPATTDPRRDHPPSQLRRDKPIPATTDHFSLITREPALTDAAEELDDPSASAQTSASVSVSA